MTYFGPHERTVVQGDDQCTCGRDWPCDYSAEGRLALLRDFLQDSARGMDAEEYRASVIARMDELEAGR